MNILLKHNYQLTIEYMESGKRGWGDRRSLIKWVMVNNVKQNTPKFYGNEF